MMECMEQSDWYVVYTESRAERNVMRQLKEKGIESRFPSRRHVCQWGDSTREVDVPLVCGCLCVNTKMCHLREILSLDGVLGCSYEENNIAEYSDDEIERLWSRLKRGSG